MISVVFLRRWAIPVWLGIAALSGVLIVESSAEAQTASASSKQRTQSSSKSGTERVQIEPYTGPPIYLEEKKIEVPPTIVKREVLDDPYPDSKQLRVQRQVAKYSDNHYESDGFYREFHPNGKKFIEGQFKQGRREGEWTYTFDNDQPNRMVTYQNGQLHGEWEVYRADGTLASKQSFENGLRHGTWITYDSTGKQPLAEQKYDKGKFEGVWKVWYPNGKLRQQLSFKAGLQHGPSAQWKDDGSPASEANWVDGKLDGTATVWREGTKTIQQYKNGLLLSEKREQQ
jgi:antitoxin component YwqK of YwqJK toxin-antitoxin module